MLQKKICMLGSFAVGKTSLVSRFVHSIYSEKYHTTVGVKVDRKVVKLAEKDVNLLIWDLHGDDAFQQIRTSYLRGMAGYLLVADGTRSETLEVVVRLRQLAESTVGEVPFSLLVNKADLADRWEIKATELTKLADSGWHVVKTSAKTGEHVEDAFHRLARQVAEKS